MTLCDPMDCSPPGSSVHGDSPGKYTKVGCHDLLYGILPTQGSNPGLLHCRRILYQAEPPGKPKNTGLGSLSLLQGIFPTQESNQGLLHCRQVLHHMSHIIFDRKKNQQFVSLCKLVLAFPRLICFHNFILVKSIVKFQNTAGILNEVELVS